MPLSSADIVRVETNVQAVNTWAEGDAATMAVMANGRNVPSPMKVITDAHMFKAPTAFSAAVTYTDATQPVTEAGVVYAPIPSLLPIGPAAFNSAEWYVVQGYISGSGATLDMNNGSIINSGNIVVDNTTDSSSTITGSIQTDGGLGVAKSSYLGGRVNISNNLNSAAIITQLATTLSNGNYTLDVDSSAQTANMTAAGAFRVLTNGASFIVDGLGDLNTTGIIKVDRSAVDFMARLTSSHATQVNGIYVHASVAAGLSTDEPFRYDDVGGLKFAIDGTGGGYFAGKITINDVTDATSTLTGSIQTDGGLGVAKAAYMGSCVIGSPTGGNQGAGTLNAVGVYDDGALLTCYVVDAAIDNAIDLDAWNDRVPNRITPAVTTEVLNSVDEVEFIEVTPEKVEVRNHEPASRFMNRMERDLNPETFYEDMKMRRALPAFPTREEWATDGPLSLGDVIQRLWETVETQAVHTNVLLERIKLLEG